jgi:WD40 repeat protein
VADVFVSYSRRDSAYVQRLVEALQSRGKDIWVDVEGIRDAEVFPAALRRAVEGSDAFVFVISPDSVHSDFCEQEVDRAVELNKRVVPLALRAVPDEEIPDEIRVRNWIPAGDDGEFDSSVDRLVKALDTDLDWEHQHTRLIVKALEWDQAGRDRNLLLRGSELTAAEQWLAAGAGKDPGPTELEREYLLAGRVAASRRQRMLVGISLGIAAISIALVIFALISRSQAISARNTAKQQAATAKSRALAAESQTQLAIDPERSILLAGDAVRASATPEGLFALRAALDASPIRFRLPDAGPQNCGQFFTVVPDAAFSPDGRRLAEGTCQGNVVLADARTGRVIRRVRVGSPAGTVAYNRDGSLLAAVVGRRTVLLDPATGAIRRTGPPVAGTRRILFSPTAPVLAITGNGDLTLWNVRTNHRRAVHFGGPGRRLGPTGGLAFSPDGKRLAVTLQTGQANGILMLDAASGRTIVTNGHPFGAASGVNTDQMSFSPDGKQLAAAQTLSPGGEGRIVILDSRTLARRRTLTRLPAVEASAVAFSPDGRGVAFGGADGTAELVSAQTGRAILSYHGQTALVSKVAFSPDGRLVATASQDGTLRVWSATKVGPPAATFGGTVADVRALRSGFVVLGTRAGRAVVQAWPAPRAHPGPPLELSPTANVNAEFISPDGRLAGVIPLPREGFQPTAPIRVWNIADRRVVANVPPSIPPFGGEPNFSPDGKTIAMGKQAPPPAPTERAPKPGQPVTSGPAMVLVDVRTGKNRQLGTTPCGAGWRDQPFSRDGRLVAAGTFCGQVDIWNTTTGKRVGHQFSIGGELARLAFSPDGKRIAAASWNSTITVADVSTGRVVAVLTDHRHGVAAVDYSPNGRYLASASLDGTARIWDARTLRLLRILHHPDPVDWVAFTPDSRKVVTSDGAQVIRVWDSCTACGDAKALLALTRTRVTRQLTPQERRTFGDGP